MVEHKDADVGLSVGSILFDTYRVDGVLGRGGMGVVFQLSELASGESFALKVLLPEIASDLDLNMRFVREAQAVVGLRGEHVARVTDIGLLPGGAPYMMMEYLRGGDLATELERRRILGPAETVEYALQACEALAEAHASGLVHRDIKPANLFLTERPDHTPLVKVLDFGISKAMREGVTRLTKTDAVMGTPGYMSPEQMRSSHEVDERTDIWALGVVLYECLTGARPFEADTFSGIVLATATAPPPAMGARIPRGLQAVVLRCLAKLPDDRYASVADLAAALVPFARDRGAATLMAARSKLLLKGMYAGREQAIAPARPVSDPTIAAELTSVPAPGGRKRAWFVAALALTGVLGGLSTAVIVRAGAPDDVADPAHTAEVVREAERTAVTARCDDLEAAGDWRELVVCAAALDAIAGNDEGGVFHARATRELALDAKLADARRALGRGDLIRAAEIVATIAGGGSRVSRLRSEVAHAEARATDDAVRAVEGYASAHDCEAAAAVIRRLDRVPAGVILAARAVPCEAAAPGASGGRAPRLVRPPATPAKPPAWFPAEPPAASAPAAPPDDDLDPCARASVDRVLTQAVDYYRAGDAVLALARLQTVLQCRASPALYSMATAYACAAGDAPAAFRYFARVAANARGAVEALCQPHGIVLRAP